MRRSRAPVALAAWYVLLALAVGCASSGKATSADPAALDDEPALMEKLRAAVDTAPAVALSLADEGERRFGNSPAAEERRALAISALINLQQIGAARSRAYDFLRRYPSGPRAVHVAAMTGVHVPPSSPDASPSRPPCDAR